MRLLCVQGWALGNVVVPAARLYGMEEEYAYLRPSIQRFPTGADWSTAGSSCLQGDMKQSCVQDRCCRHCRPGRCWTKACSEARHGVAVQCPVITDCLFNADWCCSDSTAHMHSDLHNPSY